MKTQITDSAPPHPLHRLEVLPIASPKSQVLHSALHRHREIHRLQRLSDLHTIVSVHLFDQFQHLKRHLSDPKMEWVR